MNAFPHCQLTYIHILFAADFPDNVTLHHQQFSSNSESFILQLGQPLG